jgi:hypothetical protein
MAIQDFRRKRDRLALDCVRLGKITTVRTGPTSVGDVWEEGYALKELNKRSAELLERKEKLESRKKHAQSLKRAAKKGSSNNLAAEEVEVSNEIDADLDLATEAEVIRAHLEQLKRFVTFIPMSLFACSNSKHFYFANPYQR